MLQDDFFLSISIAGVLTRQWAGLSKRPAELKDSIVWFFTSSPTGRPRNVVVHRDEPDRRSDFLRQCLPHAPGEKKREKVREARSNAKNDERRFARRVSDRTQVDDKPDMYEERARKREVRVARMLPPRREYPD